MQIFFSDPQIIQCLKDFEKFSKDYFKNEFYSSLVNSREDKGVQKNKVLDKLIEALDYTFFHEGKRFRPLLCFQTASIFNLSFERVQAVALATELVHVYSLIHDDLPCVDDSETRRGKKTCHKVFGEAQALMTGNLLANEAFKVLAQSYEPEISNILFLQLSETVQKMIKGQVLDISKQNFNSDEISSLCKLKTAELISFAATAPALIADARQGEIEAIRNFSKTLGLAFQIKDDLLDKEELKNSNNRTNSQSPDTNRSEEKALEELKEISKKAEKYLNIFENKSRQAVIKFIDYNLNRGL